MIFSSPPQFGQCYIGRTFTDSPHGPPESDDSEAAAAEYPLMAATASSRSSAAATIRSVRTERPVLEGANSTSRPKVVLRVTLDAGIR